RPAHRAWTTSRSPRAPAPARAPPEAGEAFRTGAVARVRAARPGVPAPAPAPAPEARPAVEARRLRPPPAPEVAERAPGALRGWVARGPRTASTASTTMATA